MKTRQVSIFIFCSGCNKQDVFCKGMCQACYSKMQRNTEKGKERTKAYNLTAGKEAQRKFRERIRDSKPEKPLKVNCKCGKISVSKNLCMTCYQRFYQRKKNGWQEGARKNKHDSQVIFKKVLDGVKKGFTIQTACKWANVNRGTLYRLISTVQKDELYIYKKIGFVDENFN